MKVFRLAIFIVLALLTSIASPQENPRSGESPREFLVSLDQRERASFRSRYALEVRSEEYFSVPQRFGLYRFDVELLEKKGEIFSITIPGSETLEVISNGVERDEFTGWFLGKWTGEIRSADSNETYPLKWTITTWSVDSEGRLGAPDPNRDYTLATLNRPEGVVTEESLLRLDEQIVHSISGNIVHPQSRRKIRLRHPKDNPEYLMVYEIDPEKELLPISDMAEERDLSTEYGRESLRREQAYQQHVDSVKRELGIAQPLERN